VFYPPYRILKTIAHHEGRETFLALNTQTDTEVIIKALHVSQINRWESHEQFEREVQALLYLKHPQIPNYIDHFEACHHEKTLSCVVIEKIAGETLAERIEKGVRISEPEAIAFARSVLVPLIYLHHLSPPLIHRDIKPSNLMVDAENTAYIIDFGAMQGTSLSKHTVAGTFGYMAPEQVTGRASVHSDLYNLGVTLLSLLSHLPPEEMPREDLRFNIDAFLNVSAFFRSWLDTLVEPLAKDRFASAEEALTALDSRTPTKAKPQSQLTKPEVPAHQGRIEKDLQRDRIRYTLPAAYQWGDILSEIFLFTCIFLAPFGAAYWVLNTFLPLTYARWGNYILSPFFALTLLVWAWVGGSRLKSNLVSASLEIGANTLSIQHRWFSRLSEKPKTFNATQIKAIDFNHTYGLLFTSHDDKEFELYFEATLAEKHWLASELKPLLKDRLPREKWAQLERHIQLAQAEDFLLESPEKELSV
jgi:serine/threonine protein kinase